MANNITNIYFSNTFGDLVRTANNLVTAWNYLGFTDWDKPSGTFSISSTGTGFRANTDAVFARSTRVEGFGSSFYVQNNAEIVGKLTLSNTSILCFESRGIANINYINVTNTETSMIVSGNSSFQKNITVSNYSYLNTVTANSIVVSNNVFGNTANFSSNVTLNNAVCNNSIYTVYDVNANRNVNVNNNLNVVNNINTSNVNANVVNTKILSISENLYSNSITSNTNISAVNVYADMVNTNVVLSSTIGQLESEIPSVNTIYTKSLLATSATVSNKLTVNGGMTVAGKIGYEANEIVLSANTPVWNLGGLPAQVVVNRVYDGLGGGTMYTANANASLYWSESSKKWKVVDVVNSTSNIDLVYADIILSTDINDNVTSKSITKVASANSVNATYTFAKSAYDSVFPVYLHANSAFLQANGGFVQANASFLQANGGFVQANASFSRANTSANSFIGTSGSASPSTGVITLNSNNGVTLVGNGSVITVSTSQDLRTTATPTFNNITLSSPLPISSGGTGANTAQDARTSILPTSTTAGYVLTTGGPGNFYWAIPTGYANNITFTTPFGGFPSSANNIQLAIQDLDTRKANVASPGLTGTPTAPTAATNTSTTQIATTAFVLNQANSGLTFAHSISGNAGTVTNGVYTNGSYSDPTWITGLAGSKISGNISGNAGTVTNGVYTTGSYSNPAWITGLAGSKISGDIGGNASNITSYTVNQSVGTGNNVQFNSLGVGTAGSGTAGEIRATNDITAYYSSDKRLKENIRVIDSPLDKILNINGVYFDWTDDYINSHGGEDGYFIRKQDIGVIAQEVESVLPEVVATREDGYKAVKYEKIIALLIESVKELKSEIETLKGK